MKAFTCKGGNVKVTEIGGDRTAFETPRYTKAKRDAIRAVRRARSQSIRAQNVQSR